MPTPMTYPGATEFLNLAVNLALTRGKSQDLREALQATRSDRLIRISKAAITAGSLADPAWGGGLGDYKVISDEFAKTLVQASAFDWLISNGANVGALLGRYAITTAKASGSMVGEGLPKPVATMAFSVLLLSPMKASALVVLSDDLLRFSSAPAIMGRALRDSLGAAKDEAFLPALVDSATPSVASSGDTSAAIGVDLAAALAEMTLHASSRLVLVVEPAVAASLSVKMAAGVLAFPEMTPQGGAIAGIPVVASDGLADGTALLVDASQLLLAQDVITLDSSSTTTLQMRDDPVAGPQNAVSLYGSDSTALRAEQIFASERLGDAAVVQITGVDW